MSCASPIYAYYEEKPGPNGKRRLSFSRTGGVLHGRAIALPCGKCVECRLARSNELGIRCYHESKMHPVSVFLTLTYDDDNLPYSGSLVKRHLQLFHKRLRKYFWKYDKRRVRHFSCGEYGSTTKRAHYHVCLFGGDFIDKRYYGKSELGHDIFSSQILDLLWSHGQCKIGEFNLDTARYTARYCVDKIDGEQRDDGYYLGVDEYGVVCERQPEFGLMSLKPGIGASWYEKFGHECRRHDNVIIGNKSYPVPRYYDKMFEKLDPHGYAAIKRLRSPIHSFDDFDRVFDDNTTGRRIAKQTIVRSNLKQKRRN